MEIGEKSRRTIESKGKVIEGMSKEVDRILDDNKKEYENSIKILKDLTKGYEEIIQTLEDELKKGLEVLNVPPIETMVGQGEKLMNALNIKEEFIECFKAQFVLGFIVLPCPYLVHQIIFD